MGLVNAMGCVNAEGHINAMGCVNAKGHINAIGHINAKGHICGKTFAELYDFTHLRVILFTFFSRIIHEYKLTGKIRAKSLKKYLKIR